ncbi:NAD(P)-dependent oxidoreductase [Acidocella sp.]|uniref:NAD(P)-dependent oxidoreductase n=1 Tax=Acidocella sp. TaxID=50710 RepID=UPI00260620BA|nr:NAD(P)-dependent oxidoreductase [Acidocella sp.]
MICLLGFGEVGQIFATDWGTGFSAWDVKFADPGSAPAKALAGFGLSAPASAHEAVRDARLVVSAVTAAEDEAAARAVAGGLAAGAYFLDVNSASPGQKRRAAEVIEAAGGRYVEGVIMSPIGHKRLASPLLLGGPHAAEFEAVARAAGFGGARVYAAEIGLASATKLCRSVMIKGIEALLTESLLTARHYGVEAEVLGSLGDFFPGQDWEKLAYYMIGRGLQHGARRAEEMREAAETVAEAGLVPLMSVAIAARQDLSAGLRHAFEEPDLPAMLDAMARPK